MTSPEPQQPLNRRRTDGDGKNAVRAAHRAIAEHAYRLYAEGGYDRRRVAECWRIAEQARVDHPAPNRLG
jgi:vacuolar-type H+-ATPase subunit B/Vma2